jgi:hypothetical protein
MSLLAIWFRRQLVSFLVVSGYLDLAKPTLPSRVFLFDELSYPAFCAPSTVVPGFLVLITSYLPVTTSGWPLQLPPSAHSMDGGILGIQIHALVKRTHRVRVDLSCYGSTWRLFPQFFALFELLQKHGIPVYVNGRSPSRHPRDAPGNYRINIAFRGPRSPRRLEDLLLKVLHSAHKARDRKEARHRKKVKGLLESRGHGELYDARELRARFNDVVKRGGCTKSDFKLRLFGKVEHFKANQNFSAYVGPSDLLYNTSRSASIARQAVNNGQRPSTKALSPVWVRQLLTHLRAWRRALRDHSLLLENTYSEDSALGLSTLPNDTLPIDRGFGLYDNVIWSNRPNTRRRLK